MSDKTALDQTLQDFLRLMQTLLGGLSQRDFRRFVHTAWRQDRYAMRLPNETHELLDRVAEALIERQLDVTDCFRADQPCAINGTLWDDEFAIRVVSDSPDGRPVSEPISHYNIEPHFHFADSIIIVASRPKGFTGNYLLHRIVDGEDFIIETPLQFGNVIAFPAGVNHTFKPSGNGLITINMTHELIVPQTPNFGADTWVNLDNFPRRSASIYSVEV